MNLFNINDLYVGVLVTINKQYRKKPNFSRSVSKKLVLERIVKDGETFFNSLSTGTFAPAMYESKTLIEGMIYVQNIEPLTKYYNDLTLINVNTIKEIENKINISVISRNNEEKLYDINDLYVGRIYSYMPNNSNHSNVTLTTSREYIFEKIEDDYYREINSKVTFKKLSDYKVVGESYVIVESLKNLLPYKSTISKSELEELDIRLSTTCESCQRKIKKLSITR